MTRTLLRGGRVFDGTGADPSAADVVVADGRIVEVGSGLDGDEEVAADGLTILPGLFDCHTHVTVSGVDLLVRLQKPFSYQFYEAARNLSATLDCGITTVRDAAGADQGIQRAVEDGLIEGPRLKIAITLLSQTGGHGDGWMASGMCAPLSVPHPGRPDGLVDGPDQIRRKVRELVRAGADVIKVATSGGVLSPRDNPRHAHFDTAELAALVAEARTAGLAVMAHAQATDGIKNAVRAGIRSIEHGIYLDDEAIAMMLDAGTFLVPTLVAPQAVLDAVGSGANLPAAAVAKAQEVLEIHRDSVARAVRAGVRLAMGTDSGVGPHGHNLDELVLMQRAGMPAPEVLAATTSVAAELLGVCDELGTIAPGKRADLVLVAGDPYDFTGYRERIRAVYQDGRPVRCNLPDKGA
jgi:imidazolonepropionase-like amidohydrolase